MVQIYRYWAKASEPVRDGNRSWNLTCYGGSNTSVEEALQRAAERAKSATDRIRHGGPPQAYAYSHRPLREEIVKEFHYEGRLAAVLTRNAYGSLVMNTEHVFFADIDYAPQPLGAVIGGWLSRLFGRRRATQDDAIVHRVERIARARPDLGIRLYRTANGFRCLATTVTYHPTDRETENLLNAFGSDPLYVTLCQRQACFRARLSPKHWRCGVPRPPSRYPWADSDAERDYRDWERTYEAKAGSYSTCAFIAEFGPSHVHPAVEPVLTIHDRLACDGDGPLA